MAWLEVRNTDLPQHVDPAAFLDSRMAAAELTDAVALMPSRDIRRHQCAQAAVGDAHATCLTTVGLSNALRVGLRSSGTPARIGTINILVHVSQSLSRAAMIETLSVATQARTAALLELDYRPDGSAITGTGTDCIVVAAPVGGEPAQFAGLHTAIGEAVGACVVDAMREGGQVWLRERSASDSWKEPPESTGHSYSILSFLRSHILSLAFEVLPPTRRRAKRESGEPVRAMPELPPQL